MDTHPGRPATLPHGHRRSPVDNPLFLVSPARQCWGNEKALRSTDGQASQPAAEYFAHEVAGPDHIRVSESVVDLASVSLCFNQSGSPEHREVLGDIRLAGSDFGRESPNVRWSISEPMEDFQSARAGQNLEDLGLEDRDFFHG